MLPENQDLAKNKRRRRWMGALAGFVLAAIVTIAGVVHRGVPEPPRANAAESEAAVLAAIEESRQRVLRQPRSALAWGLLGEAFVANEMENEASVCFQRAEHLDAKDPRWPYYQGGLKLNRGNSEEALQCFERALARGSQSEAGTMAHFMLGETLLRLGRLHQAEAHFQAVLDEQSDDRAPYLFLSRAHFDMGLVAQARQDWQTSRMHLERCLQGPARKKASVQLAAVCQRLDDAASADKYRSWAERLPLDFEWLDPLVTDYVRLSEKKRNRHRLAQELESAGDFAGAAEVLRRMTEQYPDDYLPFLMLGRVLGQLGDAKAGEKAVRRALHLSPKMLQGHYYLSLLLVRQAEELWPRSGAEHERARELFGEAADHARRALADKPDYGFAHMVLGIALRHLGQRKEALASLQEAVRCNPEHAELHVLLGEFCAEDGRLKEARRSFEEALRLAPQDPRARAGLARLAP